MLDPDFNGLPSCVVVDSGQSSWAPQFEQLDRSLLVEWLAIVLFPVLGGPPRSAARRWRGSAPAQLRLRRAAWRSAGTASLAVQSPTRLAHPQFEETHMSTLSRLTAVAGRHPEPLAVCWRFCRAAAGLALFKSVAAVAPIPVLPRSNQALTLLGTSLRSLKVFTPPSRLASRLAESQSQLFIWGPRRPSNRGLLRLPLKSHCCEHRAAVISSAPA